MKENSRILFDCDIAETIVESMRLHSKVKNVQVSQIYCILLMNISIIVLFVCWYFENPNISYGKYLHIIYSSIYIYINATSEFTLYEVHKM